MCGLNNVVGDNMCDDYEIFLFTIYTPVKGINSLCKILAQYIMKKRNECVSFLSKQKICSQKKDPCGSSSLIRTALSGLFYYVVCLCVFSLVCIGLFNV